MERKTKNILVAAISGLVFVAAFAGLSSIPHLEVLGLFSASGLLLAALFFPQGVHSDAAASYLILAIAVDVLLYGFLSYLVVRSVRI